MSDHYTYQVSWSEDDHEFVATCVEFPSLSWLALEQKDALAGILDLVAEVVADMTNGELLPQPLAARTYSGKFNLRTGTDLHRRLALRAAQAGVSLNQYACQRLSEAV